MLAKTKNYRPTEKEPFMNERQREYFRVKLSTGGKIFSRKRARRCSISRRKTRIIPILPTAPHLKPTAPSSCARVIGSAS